VLTAAVAAMSNPLIEDPSIKRASGLIISITGGKDMMLFEVDEAVSRIREEADPDANIIVGASFDDSLEGIVRVSVVATGIDNLEPAREMQPAQTSVTELAGRLRNDSLGNDSLRNDSVRNAERIEQGARLPQMSSPPLRPAARASEGRPAISGYVRPAAPQGRAPHSQSSPARNSIEESLLDIPAFLRHKTN
jgi:cell division protein FtsZ